MTLIESNPFGRAIEARQVAGFDVSPLMVTWDLVVLQVRSRDAEIVLSIPGRNLDQVLDQLDSGELDDLLGRAMAANGTLGTLSGTQDPTGQPAVHDRITDTKNLVRPERDALTGQIGGPGQGGREAKNSSGQHQPVPTPSRPGLPWKPIAAVAAAVVLVVVIAVVALGGGDETPADLAAVGTENDNADNVEPGSTEADNNDTGEPGGLEGTYEITTTVTDYAEAGPLDVSDRLGESITELVNVTCNGGTCVLELVDPSRPSLALPGGEWPGPFTSEGDQLSFEGSEPEENGSGDCEATQKVTTIVLTFDESGGLSGTWDEVSDPETWVCGQSDGAVISFPGPRLSLNVEGQQQSG